MQKKKETENLFTPFNKALFFCAFFIAAFPVFAQAESDPNITLQASSFSKEIPYETYSQWFSFSSTLLNDASYKSEIENIDHCSTDLIFCEIERTEKSKINTKKIDKLSFNTEKGRAFLENLAKEADKSPEDAKFKMEGERVSSFSVEQPGFKIDTDQSLKMLSKIDITSDTFQQENVISLPYIVLEPKIKSSDINNLGISTLIGQGKSNFKGSPKSRIHNIRMATSKYDGVLIPPGGEFSFVEILGPVDGEHGYLPELVIKKDKTEPEFGGGICQVSTTAFRAAIYSGLEITARKNHAYPVSYYNPQGMDATIYVPKPDLRFKNNTPGYILIQTKIEGTELTFDFYGTSDGRKIEIDGPHILEKKPDGSMRTTFTQKVSDKNGSVLINDTFNSFYDSPAKFPHPTTEKLTKKPEGWSKKEWETYKKANGL